MSLFSGAQACRGPMWSLFFSPPLSDTQADFVAKVTITQIVTSEGLDVPEGRKRFYKVALGSVGEVIKGNADTAIIKIAIMPTSCGPVLNASSIGRTGIVAGNLTKDRDGMWVLFVRGGSQAQRDKGLGQHSPLPQ